MAFDEMTAQAMRDVARLEHEVARLRTLCRRAAEHLTDHNGDYHHRTPGEFIGELLKAADGVAAVRHQSEPPSATHGGSAS